MAAKLGLPTLPGPAGRARGLALALIISRVVAPGSKLSTLAWWGDVTWAVTWGWPEPALMTSTPRWTGWPTSRTRSRPGSLPGTWPRRPARAGWRCPACPPPGWKAARCPLAARGYSRDGKKGKLQIEYGPLTDPAGRPVAVRIFPGSTGDPSAFTEIVQVVRDKFKLAQMIMVGDRGMITSARIAALNQQEDGTARPDPYEWITALRAPAIKKLMADGGPLQLSLSGQQDLA